MLDEKTMRIEKAGGAATVRFLFDGRPVRARQGESVAAALFASGTKTLRASPRNGVPRGMFCLMGSCQECLVVVDGRRALACRTTVIEGMRVDKVPEIGLDI
ncbi:(2Fe-2S)-binding protein [Paraburkholderia aspalathi]|uniref:(2Fe-2S)-binding protein n=1 Tax=Paraburkholderia aspalathi TaxID=1324617 RepID=UPI0038BB3A83